MDNIGLLLKFKVNRPLTEEEKAYQLKHDKRLNVEPLNQLSTIRINSTYLEMVDKFYGWKGYLTAAFAILISILLWFTVSDFIAVFRRVPKMDVDQRTIFLIGEAIWLTILFAFIFICLRFLLKEAFAYTHYPIRINRKSGKIYVFRLDGTILSMPWRDVFFTVGKGRPRGSYDDIRGHVLDTDGVTVKETFALSHFSGKDDPDLMLYWEYVRRYMEDGPAKLIPKIEHVIEISHKRETF